MPDFSLEARQIRLAKNQALFRTVNEQVESIAKAHGIGDPISFLCECANPDCAEEIELAHGEYEAIRQDPMGFPVLPGHVFPEVEKVADDRGQYVVVQKFGAGGKFVAAVDTRGTTDADAEQRQA